MPNLVHLYVSHSWSVGDSYDKLLRLLRADGAPTFRLYGIARDDPIHQTVADYELRAEIRKQMMSAQILLVQAGQYARMARWVDEEIDVARGGYSHVRRVLVIAPFGAELQARRLADRADRIVPWVGADIVTAIRDLAELPPEVVKPHQLVARGSETRPRTTAAATDAGPARKSTGAMHSNAGRAFVHGTDLRRNVFGMRRTSDH